MESEKQIPKCFYFEIRTFSKCDWITYRTVRITAGILVNYFTGRLPHIKNLTHFKTHLNLIHTI